MLIARYVLLALLLLPVAEIAAFYGVARAIGFWWALALLLATSLLGLAVLRGEGVLRVVRLTRAGPGQAAVVELEPAALLRLLGGALLLLPGFLTDAIGLALLLAPGLWLRLLRAHRRDERPADPGVIDLEPGEWRRAPERPLPGRRDPGGD